MGVTESTLWAEELKEASAQGRGADSLSDALDTWLRGADGEEGGSAQPEMVTSWDEVLLSSQDPCWHDSVATSSCSDGDQQSAVEVSGVVTQVPGPSTSTGIRLCFLLPPALDLLALVRRLIPSSDKVVYSTGSSEFTEPDSDSNLSLLYWSTDSLRGL